MPTKKNQKDVVTIDFSNLFDLEINVAHPVDKAIVDSGLLNLLNDAFADIYRLNQDIKTLIKSLDKKVPTTPKKAVGQYQRVMDQIAAFQKLNLEDEESVFIESDPIEPSPPPVVRQMPSRGVKKTPRKVEKTTSQDSEDTVTASTPGKPPTTVGTPGRAPPTPVSTVKAFGSSAGSRVLRPPHAATVKKTNPADIALKSKLELERAEERRKEIINDKVERAKREREEKERKVRQKKQEEEEARKKLLEQRQAHEIKLKEIQAQQIEEAKAMKVLGLKLGSTPKKTASSIPTTPRQLRVPPKKAKEPAVPVAEPEKVESPALKRKKAKSNAKKNDPAPVKDSKKTTVVKDEPTREVEESEVFVVLTPKEAAEAMGQPRRSFGFDESRIRSFENHEREISLGLTRKTGKKGEKSPKPPQIVAEASEVVLTDMKINPPPKPMQKLLEDDSTVNSATYVVSSTVVNETVFPSKSDDVMEEDDIEDLTTDENKPPVSNNKANQSSYDMTGEKIFLPSTEENYVVDDLSSGDETDDENNPRKQVPKWAKKENLNPAVREMLKTSTVEERAGYFGPPVQPTLENLFPEAKLKSNRHKNSSSVWNSPLVNPRTLMWQQ